MFCAFLICLMLDTRISHFLLIAVVTFDEEYYVKHFFVIPTDAHYYKIIGMLKTIKIPIIAAICFGSRRNHHQGAISCLAKTTIMILLCSSLMTWSMSWLHTGLLCKHAVHDRGKQES